MSNHQQTQRYYDDFSSHYDHGRDRGYHAMIDSLTFRAIRPYCEGQQVLEAGCGTGLLLEQITKNAKSAIGIDLSEGMLSHAKRRALNVVRADLSALPFEDNTFDTVCSFKVLAHVPRINHAVEELIRVTRPGGTLLLEFYNRHSLRYAARRLIGSRRIGQSHSESDIPTRWDSPSEIIARLPGSVQFDGWRGIRVLTPAAFLCRQPILGHTLQILEQQAVASPLSRFGGFLIAVLQKNSMS